MKNGMVTAKAASAAKTPFSVARSRNAGPLPPLGPPVKYTARARKTGTAASKASRARTRARRKTMRASTSHIEALPGQGHEGVFERDPLWDEQAHPNSRLHQPPAAVFGPKAVEGTYELVAGAL